MSRPGTLLECIRSMLSAGVSVDHSPGDYLSEAGGRDEASFELSNGLGKAKLVVPGPWMRGAIKAGGGDAYLRGLVSKAERRLPVAEGEASDG